MNATLPLAYTPGRNANSVSEFACGLISRARSPHGRGFPCIKKRPVSGPSKKSVLELDPQQDVVWFMPDGSSPMLEYGGGFELYGRTLAGSIGFGAIGRRVGHTAKEGFGMHVQVYDPYCPAEAIRKLRLWRGRAVSSVVHFGYRLCAFARKRRETAGRFSDASSMVCTDRNPPPCLSIRRVRLWWIKRP